MKITRLNPDGTTTTTESNCFPCETIEPGWRVTLIMSDEFYIVTVVFCNRNMLQATNGQRWLATGVQEIKLFV